MAIKAYVLVVTDPGRTKGVIDILRDIPGVVETHEVMGPYDVVVEVQVDNLTDMPPVLGESIRKIPGIQSTTSLITIPD
jgi:DNA-binding Lrp family transcriptional regulator